MKKIKPFFSFAAALSVSAAALAYGGIASGSDSDDFVPGIADMSNITNLQSTAYSDSSVFNILTEDAYTCQNMPYYIGRPASGSVNIPTGAEHQGTRIITLNEISPNG